MKTQSIVAAILFTASMACFGACGVGVVSPSSGHDRRAADNAPDFGSDQEITVKRVGNTVWVRATVMGPRYLVPSVLDCVAACDGNISEVSYGSIGCSGRYNLDRLPQRFYINDRKSPPDHLNMDGRPQGTRTWRSPEENPHAHFIDKSNTAVRFASGTITWCSFPTYTIGGEGWSYEGRGDGPRPSTWCPPFVAAWRIPLSAAAVMSNAALPANASEGQAGVPVMSGIQSCAVHRRLCDGLARDGARFGRTDWSRYCGAVSPPPSSGQTTPAAQQQSGGSASQPSGGSAPQLPTSEEACEPMPHYEWVDGRCLPSCGRAMGNRAIAVTGSEDPWQQFGGCNLSCPGSVGEVVATRDCEACCIYHNAGGTPVDGDTSTDDSGGTGTDDSGDTGTDDTGDTGTDTGDPSGSNPDDPCCVALQSPQNVIDGGYTDNFCSLKKDTELLRDCRAKYCSNNGNWDEDDWVNGYEEYGDVCGRAETS